MRGELLEQFREVCRRHDLAATHQRAVIYEALFSLPGHPTPEEIYARVREQVPSMSLATVYKTINTFLEAGIVREASLHHGSIRLDSRISPHHHIVCTDCKALFDLEAPELAPALPRSVLPLGFEVQRLSIEVQGLCQSCAKRGQTMPEIVPKRMVS